MATDNETDATFDLDTIMWSARLTKDQKHAIPLIVFAVLKTAGDTDASVRAEFAALAKQIVSSLMGLRSIPYEGITYERFVQQVESRVSEFADCDLRLFGITVKYTKLVLYPATQVTSSFSELFEFLEWTLLRFVAQITLPVSFDNMRQPDTPLESL